MRRLWLGFGCVALLAAGLAALGRYPAALSVLGRDLVVYAAATVATVVGLGMLARQALESPVQPVPPADSSTTEVRSILRYGQRLSATVDRALERPAVGESPTDRGARHVRATLIEVLVDREGCSRSAARDRIRGGTWTENPRAAAFCGHDVELPLGIWLRDWLRGSVGRRGLEASIAEVERLATEPATRSNTRGDADSGPSTHTVDDLSLRAGGGSEWSAERPDPTDDRADEPDEGADESADRSPEPDEPQAEAGDRASGPDDHQHGGTDRASAPGEGVDGSTASTDSPIETDGEAIRR